MDKQQETELRSELKSLFQSKYNSEKWQRMLIDFFGAREIRTVPRELTSEHNEKVEGRELGKLSLPGFEIGLYEFEIKKSYRIAFNRVGLRSLVKSYTNYEVDAALVVYYSGDQWRLSFICNLRDEKTAPKRFTYLFGNSDETYRTPIDRFLLLKERGVTFENIYDAFSVEKLTADFFNGYKAQFKKFCGHIGGDEKWQRDYVKKLLGRLVFLQFLQKKGWMGVPQSNKGWKGGDPNYIRTLIDRHKNNDRLLTEVLEPLFFETLNRERTDDLADPILGEHIRIPYLNGGLFDRDELDRQQIDFPYFYFDELIEFFSHYNFTIDENDPDDSDVGIDPEMLGHIFENLLEDNKDKGTFYTPKEIVQYMSRESLIQYLRSHTDASLHPAIERLIRLGEVEPALQDRKVSVQINDLFKAVKVCDPAIGSGAFPMGVLSEIFKCRRMLYGFMKNPQSFSPSQVKREIIQENIYGVDIEQGAVDIARLRFWLSLVVDEEQPQPLPNLDYKIMQGDSLLESFEGIDLSKFAEPQQADGDLFGSAFEAQTREAIQPLIKRHFSVTDHPEKEQIRAEIDGIIRKHIEDSLVRREKELTGKRNYHKQRVVSNQEFIDNPVTTTGSRRKYEKNLKFETYQLKLVETLLDKVKASREHIKQVDRTNCPFFLWHLYFKDVFDRGGFDIVIANPPYVEASLPLDCKSKYSTFGTRELYAYFFELAIKNLLNKDGIIAFITGSLYIKGLKFNKLRDLLVSTISRPNLRIAGDEVFAKVNMPTAILIGVKNENVLWSMDDFIEGNAIIGKIDVGCLKLSMISKVQRGFEIGKNQTFFDRNGVDFITGQDVGKYRVNRIRKISKEVFDSFAKDDYYFTGERLLIRETGSELTTIYLHEKLYSNRSLYSIKITEESLSVKYVLALLNSRLMQYYYASKFKSDTNIFPKIRIAQVNELPIKKLSELAQQPFIALVDQILASKRENPAADTLDLEMQIDRMVYELYGLTDDEIAIVEGREPEPPQTIDTKMKEYDFFISHATEDKNFVRPLAKVLKKAGCKVWYDEFEMKVGDSLRQKIDYGLANSRYGIVVISNYFINKNWTAYELNGMIAREIDGVKVVLPLWHNITKEEVIAYSPTLADKMALETGKHEIDQIVEKLKELLPQ